MSTDNGRQILSRSALTLSRDKLGKRKKKKPIFSLKIYLWLNRPSGRSGKSCYDGRLSMVCSQTLNFVDWSNPSRNKVFQNLHQKNVRYPRRKDIFEQLLMQPCAKLLPSKIQCDVRN